MSNLKDDFRADAGKSPEELEREIDAARQRMERTLDLLERKLSPTEIFDNVVSIAQRNGGQFARNLATQVQNKPLPSVVAGLGLLWLMASSDRPPQPYGEHSHSTGDKLRSARNRAGEMAAGIQDTAERARDTAQRARAGAHDVAESVRDQAGRAREATQRGTERVREGYRHLLEEQPLVLGGLGLTLGAALGTMLPRTEIEDELMGETSEDIKHKVQREGERQYAHAKETAQRAAGAALQETGRQQQPQPPKKPQPSAHGQPRDGHGR